MSQNNNIYCKRCRKYIWTHESKIECNWCQNKFHHNCVKNTINIGQLVQLWTCTECNCTIFPFNNIEEELEYKEAIIEDKYYNNNPINELETLLLYDIDMGDEKIDEMLQEIDPDENFYNTMQNITPSQYYSYDMFKEKKIKNNNSNNYFSIAHLNIRSVPKNFSDLQIILEKIQHNFSIIGLTETWLKNETFENYQIQGYEHIAQTRQGNKIGGGCSIFIQKIFKYKLREDLSKNNSEYETLWIEIINPNTNTKKTSKNIVMGVIYRIPGNNPDEFLTYITDTLNTISNKENKLVYYCGDFNIDLIKHNTCQQSREFIDINYSNMCMPCITKPSRITPSTATLIDNIFTNNLDQIEKNEKNINGQLLTDISDHLLIFRIENYVNNSNNENTFTYARDMSKKNKIKFYEEMSKLDLSKIYDDTDPQSSYSCYQKMINTLFITSFPLKKIIHNYKNKIAWLTEGMKISLTHKQKLYSKKLKNPSLENTKKYKDYRNKLTKVLRIAERNHYTNLLELHKSNMRKSWNIIKEIIGKAKKKHNKKKIQFRINGKDEDNEEAIANAFNTYFINIGTQLDKSMPKPKNDPLYYLKNTHEKSIFLNPCDEDEIRKHISSLKNGAPGWDEITSKIIKENSTNIAPVLTHLINLSLSNGVFPSELKTANVKPLFKNGIDNKWNNYRPISLLSVLSKIYEKTFYSRLLQFLNIEKILYNFQFGFRKEHATYMALLAFMEKIITAMERNEYTIGIFLDFSKAFDTVNHEILLTGQSQSGCSRFFTHVISLYRGKL